MIESDSWSQQLQRGQEETELALGFGKEKRGKRLARGPGNASCETKGGVCVTDHGAVRRVGSTLLGGRGART